MHYLGDYTLHCTVVNGDGTPLYEDSSRFKSDVQLYKETCPNDHSHIATTCVHHPACYVPTKKSIRSYTLVPTQGGHLANSTYGHHAVPQLCTSVQVYLLE